MSDKTRATITVETRGDRHAIGGDALLALLTKALMGRTFAGTVTLTVLGAGDVIAVDADGAQTLHTVQARQKPDSPQTGMGKLLKFQPNAIDIRDAGKCQVCKRAGLLSYTLPDSADRMVRHVISFNPDVFEDEPDKQSCGYFCPHCGYGNAGVRERAADGIAS